MSYEILVKFENRDDLYTFKKKIDSLIKNLSTFDMKSSDVEYLLRWNNDSSLEEDAIIEFLPNNLLITVHAENPKLEKDIKELILELNNLSNLRTISDSEQEFWELLRKNNETNN